MFLGRDGFCVQRSAIYTYFSHPFVFCSIFLYPIFCPLSSDPCVNGGGVLFYLARGNIFSTKNTAIHTIILFLLGTIIFSINSKLSRKILVGVQRLLPTHKKTNFCSWHKKHLQKERKKQTKRMGLQKPNLLFFLKNKSEIS